MMMRKAAVIGTWMFWGVIVAGTLASDARVANDARRGGGHRYTAYAKPCFTLDEGASISRDLLTKGMASGSRSLYRRALSKVVEIDGVKYDREDAIDKIETELGESVRAGRYHFTIDINSENTLWLISHGSKDLRSDEYSSHEEAGCEVCIQIDSADLKVNSLEITFLVRAETIPRTISATHPNSQATDSVLLHSGTEPPRMSSARTMRHAASVSTTSGQSLIHVFLHDEDPEIRRLSMNFTTTELGKRLVGSMRGAVMSNIEGTDSLYGIEPQIILMDASWQRLLTVTDRSSATNAWWSELGIPDHNLQFPVAIDIDNGDWSGSTNPGANVYLVEYGDRPLVLHLFFAASNSLALVDSLSLSSDSLLEPSDCVIDDNGTVGNPNDDSLWVLDCGARSVVRYSCMGNSGCQATIQLPSGTGTGEFEYPTRIAIGRSFPHGGATDELYVLDKSGKVARFLVVGSDLQFEAEYIFASTLNGANVLQDLAVDAYGHVYVIESPSSRIYKLSSDLELVNTYDNKGELPSQCFLPITIQNPPSSESYASYGDLILAEYWGANSGAQRYAIGVAATGPDPTIDNLPYSISFDYTATDPHYLSLDVSRRALSGGAWSSVQSLDLGLHYSGRTTGIPWAVSDTGFGYTYQFTLTLKSTYFPWKDPWNIHPDDPTDPDDIQTNEAVLACEVEMGNRAPVVTSPLAITCIQGTCIPTNIALTVGTTVVDNDTPGNLTYTWSASGQSNVRLYDPSLGAWVSSVTGPWDSLAVKVFPGTAPEYDPEYAWAKIQLEVSDAGGGVSEQQISFSECSSWQPVCPYQGDFDENGFIDGIDLNFLIDALFFGGANPQDPQCPTSRSDLNADGSPDAVDLNYLIDLLFFGGPEPVNPCSPI